VISLSSRGLSNNEINRCLARLRDIIRLANSNYDLGLPDPTVGRRLPSTEPPRAWLRPHHLRAIFDAAAELDEEARAEYADLGRHDACVVLALGGPRVSEFSGLRWRDTHLDTREIHIAESKTSAGERDIYMHPSVEDALRRRREHLDPRPDDHVFATASGRRRDRNSVRNRLLGPTLRRAADLLAQRDQRPLPGRVTPHTFRRTYLTYLAWAGQPERFAMSQAGHKDAKLTLEVYQQPFPNDQEGLNQVKDWLGLSES
jgi:integrase